MEDELNYLSQTFESLAINIDTKMERKNSLMSQQAKRSMQAEIDSMQSELGLLNNIINYITINELKTK